MSFDGEALAKIRNRSGIFVSGKCKFGVFLAGCGYARAGRVGEESDSGNIRAANG